MGCVVSLVSEAARPLSLFCLGGVAGICVTFEEQHEQRVSHCSSAVMQIWLHRLAAL